MALLAAAQLVAAPVPGETMVSHICALHFMQRKV